MKRKKRQQQPWEIPVDFASCQEDTGWKKLTALYKLYRDYMKHEDDLLNQRTTWHLLIQGFLFTTLGVIGEWQNPHGEDRLYLLRGFLVYILVLAGLVIAVAASISVNAANDAIEALYKKWQRVLITYQRESKNLLPEIAGGGDATARDSGKRPTVWIPRVLIAAWILIGLMSAIDHVRLYTASTAQQAPQTVSSPTPDKSATK